MNTSAVGCRVPHPGETSGLLAYLVTCWYCSSKIVTGPTFFGLKHLYALYLSMLSASLCSLSMPLSMVLSVFVPMLACMCAASPHGMSQEENVQCVRHPCRGSCCGYFSSLGKHLRKPSKGAPRATPTLTHRSLRPVLKKGLRKLNQFLRKLRDSEESSPALGRYGTFYGVFFSNCAAPLACCIQCMH